MKKIYLVLSYTGTVLSNIIKLYTKNEFSHVSIALDEELEELYSFGRLKPYNPFKGGFVHEGINIGTFKRFPKARAAVYSLTVSDMEYQEIEKNIKKFKEKKDLYTFNTVGLFLVAINKKIIRENSFYCAEFVRYILETSGVKLELPQIIQPEDFKKVENLKLVYKGYLRKYKYRDTWNKIKDMKNILSMKTVNNN